MSKREERGLISQLIRVMKHIIKWIFQPEKRSKSWSDTIHDGRKDIKHIQKDHPKLNREFIRQNWNNAFNKAKKAAEEEMNKKVEIDNLTERQVFDDEYKLRNKE